MDTVDKVAPKRGRPKKEEPVSVTGQYLEQEAKKFRDEKGLNPIVDKYWKLVNGDKLCLIKVKKSGREVSEYIGSVKERRDASDDYQKRRKKLLEVIKEKEALGKLKRV